MARFSGTRIVAICFLGQNCGVGISYGTFGPLITTIQHEFGGTRGLASSGLSMLMVALAVLSPFIGAALQRWSIRAMMTTGAFLNLVGYLLLSRVTNTYELLAVYGLFIGPGVAMLSIVPPVTLISRWFIQGRGKALGIMNTPLFIMFMPLMASTILIHFGMSMVFLGNAAIFAVLTPLTYFMIIETPESVGQLPRGVNDEQSAEAVLTGPHLVTRQIVARKEFWLLSLGASLLTAVGIIMTVQLVPLLTSRGMELRAASGIMSFYGMILAIGAVAFGWLADRRGSVTSFVMMSFTLVAPWVALVFVPVSVVAYVVLTSIAALCHGAITTLHSGSANEIFGRKAFSRIMGLCYFVKLPFMASAAPMAGYIYDFTGSYNAALLVAAAMAFIAGLMFWTLNGVRFDGGKVAAVAAG